MTDLVTVGIDPGKHSGIAAVTGERIVYCGAMTVPHVGGIRARVSAIRLALDGLGPIHRSTHQLAIEQQVYRYRTAEVACRTCKGRGCPSCRGRGKVDRQIGATFDNVRALATNRASWQAAGDVLGMTLLDAVHPATWASWWKLPKASAHRAEAARKLANRITGATVKSDAAEALLIAIHAHTLKTGRVPQQWNRRHDRKALQA